MSHYISDTKLKEAERYLETFSNKGDYKILLAYPNRYSIGMASLGFHTIFRLFASADDCICERVFLPLSKGDFSSPLSSWENGRNFSDFDLIAFSCSYELDFNHLLMMLQLGKIPLLNKDRNNNHPLIMLGGITASLNPEPLAESVDVFFIGEAEEHLPKVLNHLKALKGSTRKEIKSKLAQLDGLYVPDSYKANYNIEGKFNGLKALNNAPAYILPLHISDLDKHKTGNVILTPYSHFGDMYLIELGRGCAYNCLFCASSEHFKPFRNRSLENVKRIVKYALQYTKKIGLIGSDVGDFPKLDELCEFIIENNNEIGLASLRADALSSKLVSILKDAKVNTLTIAPEAGSQRLREVIRKKLDEKTIIKASELIIYEGIKSLKLYFIIGLPTETEEDISELILLVNRIYNLQKTKRNTHITIRLSPFVPKPGTAFQWTSLLSSKIIKGRVKRIQKALYNKKGLKILYKGHRQAIAQTIISRGDRRLNIALNQL